MGIYYSASCGKDGAEAPRYIHSKVMIVDDVFMTVGSANTNNRSMGFDTELNVSWEARPGRDRGVRKALRRARVALLKEHAGVLGKRMTTVRGLGRTRGLVDLLDRLAEDSRTALFHHPMGANEGKASDPGSIPAEPGVRDPELSIVEEDEPVSVASGPADGFMRRHVLVDGGRATTVVSVRPPLAVARSPNPILVFLVRLARRGTVGRTAFGLIALALLGVILLIDVLL